MTRTRAWIEVSKVQRPREEWVPLKTLVPLKGGGTILDDMMAEQGPRSVRLLLGGLLCQSHSHKVLPGQGKAAIPIEPFAGD